MKPAQIVILLLVFMFANFSARAKSYVYITDQLDIPMRSDHKFGDNIVRAMPSGSKLEILQTTDDGWTKVQFDASTGWIISRYLSSEPPAREALKVLKNASNTDRLTIEKHKQLIKKLQQNIKQLKIKNATLAVQTSKYKSEKLHVEQIYQDALKLEHQNEQLTTKILQLQTEVQLLTDNNQTNNQEISARNWFIVGAIVLFFGMLIGFILPNFIRPRKRY